MRKNDETDERRLDCRRADGWRVLGARHYAGGVDVTRPGARVLLDSVSPTGNRVTTMEVVMHRFILAEFNTHRAFSRNSASSRATPYKKIRDKVFSDPAFPVSWPAER